MSEDYKKLPLRLLGLRHLPAVPIDIEGMIETLVRLGIRSKETQQSMQSLTRPFTIGPTTASAHAFLFGGEPIGEREQKARDRLRHVLGGDTAEVLEAMVGLVHDEGEGLFQDLMETVQGKDQDLTKLSLDQPDQWSMSWTTLPDVWNLGQPHLEEWAATVDVQQPQAASDAFWPTIAQYGLAYNLLLPNKVDEESLDGVREVCGAAWSERLEAAAVDGRLYVIDLRIYESLEPQEVDDATRFTPSTYTVLVQDGASKHLMPEVVRVAGHKGDGAQVFSRPGGLAAADFPTADAAWVYALLAAKTSVTVYGIWFGHVYHWHLVTAAMQMTMYNTLDSDHPVRRLLDPQSNDLIPFDDVLLVLWRFIAPPTSVNSGWQFLQLSNDYAKGRQFFEDDPTDTLQRLGIEEQDFSVHRPWDQYPIVGQLLSIWNATGQYVTTYVDHCYPTDQDVRDDEPLQQWIAASGNKRDGNVQGLPAMDSRENLRRVLHSLIYRITAHGCSRLYRAANPALTFVANFPPTLQDSNIPEPSQSFDTKTLLQYLPKTGTIGGMVNFYFTFSFSVPYTPFVPIEGLHSNLYLEDGVTNEALVALRQFVSDFITAYQPDNPQIHQWPLNIET